MSLGRKIAIGVGVFFLAIGLVIFFVFKATAPFVAIADAFLAELAAGDVAKAYDRTSSRFRNGTSQDQLAAFAEGLALAGLKETTWGSRGVETSVGSGPAGHLKGSLIYDDGTSSAVEFDFVEEGDAWLIYAIRGSGAGLQSADGAGQMPSEAQTVALVRETMGVFAAAVATGSMQAFHDHTSIPFQTQFSVARFDEIYGAFFALGDALKVTDGMSPVFSQPPFVTEEGVLSIKGHYPTQPERCEFEMNYTREGLGWKLVGFQVNIGGG